MLAPAARTELIDRLRRFDLLPDDRLTQLSERDAELESPESFAAGLVKSGALTAYQAEKFLEDRLESLVFGGYRLLEPIGAGGMGEVFQAVQIKLNRVVALKRILPELAHDRADALARFRREALAVARLTHPNIAHIYDADEANGTHFIAMEYVRGPDLAKLVHSCGPLPDRVACDFIRQAALGLQHAHEAGLVHRDVKPSNLLAVLPEKGASSGRMTNPYGVVKLVDLGLARISIGADDAELTRERGIMGTPDYIAPEQARDARKADTRSDLYSLGCTFYFLLTGQPPFPHGTPIEKVLCHQLERPKPITGYRSDVNQEVIAFVNKLLRKEPRDRYQTPGELADALGLFLNRTTAQIFAWPPSPRGSGSSGAATPTRIGEQSVVASPPPASANPKDAQRAVHTVPLAELGPPPSRLRELLQGTRLPSAGDASVPGNKSLLGTAAEALANEPLAPPPMCRVIKAVTKPDVSVRGSNMFTVPAHRSAVLQGHTAPVVTMTFGPGGRYLATGGLDHSVRMWRLDGENTRQQTAFLDSRLGEVRTLAFQPTGEALLVSASGQGGRVWRWRWQDETDHALTGLEESVGAAHLAVCAGNKQIAAAEGNHLHLWSMAGSAWNARGKVMGRGYELTCVAFSVDSQRVFAGDIRGAVTSWRGGWRGFRQDEVFTTHSGPVTCLAVSPDDRLIATAGTDNRVRIWSKISGIELLAEISAGLRGVVRHLQFNSNGDTLTTLTDAGQAARWRTSDGEMEIDWRLTHRVSSALALADTGGLVAQGRTDGSVCLYQLPSAAGDKSAERRSPSVFQDIMKLRHRK